MDIGINGRGFFRMASEDGSIFYGRNGQFEKDKNGNIYNKVNNLFLTGYQAVNGQIVPGSPIGPSLSLPGTWRLKPPPRVP